jgi:cyclic beta-1,2-glucan synthetase
LRSDFALGLVQSAFLITFLAHQSWLMIDAMARTLFRVCYSRRHLLEWVTASQAHDNVLSDPRGLGWQISECAGFLGVVGIVVYVSGQQTWALVAPFAALWILSPLVARWASRPPLNAGQLSIRPADELALRLIARGTWRFFEKFVTAEDNMHPPDNFQEDPNPVIAHRTWPTNIGLYLLSIVAARDFGWLGTLDLLARLEGAFESMQKLERFRGHFYNWYDTSDLATLDPKYVSSGQRLPRVLGGPGRESTLDIRAGGHSGAGLRELAGSCRRRRTYNPRGRRSSERGPGLPEGMP